METIDWSAVCLRLAHYLFSGIWLSQVFFGVFILPQALASMDEGTRAKAGQVLNQRLGLFGAIGSVLSVLTGAMLFKDMLAGPGMAGDRGAWLTAGIVAALLMWMIALVIIMPGALLIQRVGEGTVQAELSKVVKRVTLAGQVNAFLSLVTLCLMMLGAGHPVLLPFSWATLCFIAAFAAVLFALLNVAASRLGSKVAA